MTQMPKDASKIVAALSRGDYAKLSSRLRPILERLSALGYCVKDLTVSDFAENGFDVIVDQPIPPKLEELIRLSDGVECFDDSSEDGTASIAFYCPSTGQTILW